jgi:hypothetical protein
MSRNLFLYVPVNFDLLHVIHSQLVITCRPTETVAVSGTLRLYIKKQYHDEELRFDVL